MDNNTSVGIDSCRPSYENQTGFSSNNGLRGTPTVWLLMPKTEFERRLCHKVIYTFRPILFLESFPYRIWCYALFQQKWIEHHVGI
jgi:hypothetical protein